MIINKHEKYVLALVAALFIVSASAQAGTAAKGKPRPPVQVSIVPVQPSATSASVKPGDAVFLKITAVSSTDATEMRIVCTPSEGFELISGDLVWSGPAAKGEERTLTFTVRSPRNGKGNVTSRVEIYSGSELLFTTTAVHELGESAKDEYRKPVGTRKDRKGQGVEEYR